MYTTVLALHSWLRWAVVLLVLIAIVRALAAGAGRRPWLPLDDRLGLFFIIVLDVQLLLGLVLYFVLSPITQAALADFGGAMGVSSALLGRGARVRDGGGGVSRPPGTRPGQSCVRPHTETPGCGRLSHPLDGGDPGVDSMARHAERASAFQVSLIKAQCPTPKWELEVGS